MINPRTGADSGTTNGSLEAPGDGFGAGALGASVMRKRSLTKSAPAVVEGLAVDEEPAVPRFLHRPDDVLVADRLGQSHDVDPRVITSRAVVPGVGRGPGDGGFLRAELGTERRVGPRPAGRPPPGRALCSSPFPDDRTLRLSARVDRGTSTGSGWKVGSSNVPPVRTASIARRAAPDRRLDDQPSAPRAEPGYIGPAVEHQQDRDGGRRPPLLPGACPW